MKKSKALLLAQISVLRDSELTYKEKFEIIEVLSKEEYFERICEKPDEEERKEQEDGKSV